MEPDPFRFPPPKTPPWMFPPKIFISVFEVDADVEIPTAPKFPPPYTFLNIFAFLSIII